MDVFRAQDLRHRGHGSSKTFARSDRTRYARDPARTLAGGLWASDGPRPRTRIRKCSLLGFPRSGNPRAKRALCIHI